MAEIISIANQKGGCGKTTTAVNLAAGLALLGMKSLLVDIDPQGNASLTYGINIEDIPISMADVLLDPDIEIKYNIFKRGEIHLAPSNPTLNYADERLHAMKGRVLKLREKLSEVEDYYDYIIIDCPPSIGVLTTNALMSSRWVIIPVDSSFYSLIGIRQFLARVEDVRNADDASGRSPALEIMGVLLTQFEEKDLLARQVMDKVRSAFESRMFRTAIRRDIRLAEAPSHLKNIFEYCRESAGATDYLNLAREVIRKTADRDQLQPLH